MIAGRAATRGPRSGERLDGGGRTAGLAVCVVLGATVVRVMLGRPAPAASVSAAVAYCSLLLAGAVVLRATLGRPPSMGQVAVGAGAGAALVAASLIGLPEIRLGARAAPATLLWWAPLVVTVSVAEELVLRGALFSALAARGGDVLALAATAIIFAAVHVPLYGVAALPIDLCAGVLLGALRVLTGGVAAPAAAHAVADLATAWLA